MTDGKPPAAILVTGAGAGIGKAVVLGLAAKGYRVFAGLRASSPRVDFGERVTSLALDITNDVQIEQAAKSISDAVGAAGLQGLINAAGIIVDGPLELIPTANFRRQLDVNVTGRFAIARALLPILRNGRGRVINIGAISGRVTPPFFGGPAAASAALAALNDAMRMEFKPFGVQVALIEPGAIRTEIFAKATSIQEAGLSGQSPEIVRMYREATRAMRDALARGHTDEPSLVVKAVMAALERRGGPKPRVLVGKGTSHFALIGKLPIALRDRILMSYLGLAKPMAAAAKVVR
jgi:NAD(P)-dependent dehydrogenase (short-subunit alcohol dehydrogenase family)